MLDNVRIHGVPLSSSDVKQRYIDCALRLDLKFDHTGTDTVAVDDSPCNNNGILNNFTTPGCWMPGLVGLGLDFDGTNDYVYLGNDSSLVSSSGAIEMWFKSNGGNNDLFYIYGSPTAENFFLIRLNSAGEVRVIIEADDDRTVNLTSDITINDNNWHHLVVTQAGSGVQIYIDGVLDSSATGDNSSDWTDSFSSVGARLGRGPGYYLDGMLDNVRIYSIPLSNADVQSAYNDLGGAEGYGCEGNPTGDPIGGGTGYSDIYTSGDYNVSNKNDLMYRLANSNSGTVVYVSQDIDLSGEEDIPIASGVILAGNRGYSGSSGPKLYCNTADTYPLFKPGANVRITGIWLEGPDRSITADYSAGIEAGGNGLEVDNCEIAGWSSKGITLNMKTDGYFHHNYIHHSQNYDGSSIATGYGIAVGAGYAVIEANEFSYCRHMIAGSGLPTSGYEACYNLMHYHEDGLDNSAIDMHGETAYRSSELRAIWRFNSKDALDTSPYNLYQQGGTWYHADMENFDTSTCWVDAAVDEGFALKFDGNDDRVTFAYTWSIISDTGAIEIWYKAEEANRNDDLFYMYKTNCEQTDYFLIRKNSLGQVRVIIEDDNVKEVDLTSATTVNDTDWHYLAVTQDGSGVTIYIDGVASSVTGSSVNSGDYWTSHLDSKGRLGHGTGYYFKGILDDVRIYIDELSSDDVELHQDNGGADQAGFDVWVHHNTIESTAESTYFTGVNIRGLPSERVEIDHNWFYQGAWIIPYMRRVHGGIGGFDIHDNLYTEDRILIE
jgi:hypothetical protein